MKTQTSTTVVHCGYVDECGSKTECHTLAAHIEATNDLEDVTCPKCLAALAEEYRRHEADLQAYEAGL